MTTTTKSLFTDYQEQVLANVQVRRHNGQCEYGPWLSPLDTDDVPVWVGELVGNAIAESDADEGSVEQGGAMFVWRR